METDLLEKTSPKAAGSGFSALFLRTLGGFSLSCAEGTVDDSNGRATQVWGLIAYLILNRQKTTSHDDLIAALWPEGKNDDPANALKNLIYRSRSLMQAAGIPRAKDLILYKGHSYRWNDDCPCTVDALEFDILAKETENTAFSVSKRIESGLDALKMYRGDFLPFAASELWAVPLISYYRSVFFSCVKTTCELLLGQKRFDEAGEICQRALSLDPFEEDVHSCFLRSLIGRRQYAAALEHYRQMTDSFYRELGVRPSEELRRLYRDITGSVSNIETDLSVIQEDLIESDSLPGAYLCDYEIFRSLYRVKARAAARTGESVFIGLLTVSAQDSSLLTPAQRARAMDELRSSIRKTLRRGDVAARFSATQYVLMLSSLTYENGLMVLARIEKAYQQEYAARRVRITSSLRPLDPLP